MLWVLNEVNNMHSFPLIDNRMRPGVTLGGYSKTQWLSITKSLLSYADHGEVVFTVGNRF